MSMISTQGVLTTALKSDQILQNSPMTQGLVNYIASKTQASTDLIGLSILSSYSIVLQGMIDVERPEVGLSPVSINALGIAEPGERKTAVMGFTEAPIVKFQEEQYGEYLSLLKSYDLEKSIYDEKVTNQRKAIAKMIKNNASSNEIKELVDSFHEAEPVRPHPIQLIVEDATPESILHDLSKGWGSAALVSAEGGTIVNGRAVKDLPIFNKFWSGETVTVTRKSSENFRVSNARLTVFVMAQPAAISKFMKKRGDESIGIGFFDRFLVCVPVSTQGTRFIVGPKFVNEEAYQKYHDTARSILLETKERHERGIQDRKIIRFSSEASRHWINLYNNTESQLKVGGRFQYARGHGSKLAENIARISALLSYFEHGDDRDITLGTLMDAERVVYYYSDHFLQCFNVLPEYIQDIYALEEYFQTLREGGHRYVRKNKILQSGPSRLRKKVLLDEALFHVGKNGSVRVGTFGRGMIIIDLYPTYDLDKIEWNDFCFRNGCNQYSFI